MQCVLGMHCRYMLDIESEHVGNKEVAAILQEPRLKAAILANELRDKCVTRG